MAGKELEVRKIDILKYAMGGLSSGIDFGIMATWLMFYLTDIVKLNPLYVGSLLLVSRLIDAVTDPLMGAIADRTNTKHGKYRPYLIYGAPLLAISIILLYSVPSSFSDSAKVTYATACYIFYVLCSTVVNMPYHSLTAIMSRDSEKRNFIVMAKQTMAGAPSGLFVNSVTLPLVTYFGAGLLGWRKYSLVVAGMTIVCFWLCAWGAKRYDVFKEKTKEIVVNPSAKQMFAVVFKNSPFLILVASNLMWGIASYIGGAANIYYFKYYLALSNFQSIIAIIGIYSVVGGLFTTLVMPFIANKIGKKNTYFISMCIAIVSNTTLYFVPKENITAVIIVLSVGALCGLNAIIWSMFPDCVEYGELKTGIRAAGTISSSFIFSNKFSLALTGLIVGYLLSSTGYVPDQTQSPETLRYLLLLRTLVPASGALLSILIMFFYPINSVYHENLLKDIEKYNINLQIYELLGKKENIKLISHCMTKLRIELNSPIEGVEELKKLSTIKGVITDGNALQIVMGPEVKKLFEDLEKIQKS